MFLWEPILRLWRKVPLKFNYLWKVILTEFLILSLNPDNLIIAKKCLHSFIFAPKSTAIFIFHCNWPYLWLSYHTWLYEPVSRHLFGRFSQCETHSQTRRYLYAYIQRYDSFAENVFFQRMLVGGGDGDNFVQPLLNMCMVTINV